MKIEITNDVSVRAGGSIKNLLKGQRVTVDEVAGRALVKRGVAKQIPRPPVQIESRLLGCKVWLCNSTSQMGEMIITGTTGVMYLPVEIVRMSKFSKEEIQACQLIKETFPGSIVGDKGRRGVIETENN